MKRLKKQGLKQLGEFGLISRFHSLLEYRSPQTVLGLGDDCAAYQPEPGLLQVLSTDCLVEGIHFTLKTHLPEILGQKALAVNLSDIAAMGATPKLALISLAIPNHMSVDFLDRFYKGLNRISQKYKVDLAGGDTVSSLRDFFINISILGEAKKNRLFTRKGAKAGDRIFVTGTLGDSSLGLEILNNPRKKWRGPISHRKTLIQKHLCPEPRIAFSQKLARSKLKITSMIDISDGLGQDLEHICIESGVGADIRETCLPASEALTKFCFINKLDPLNYILSGGEDYELLFTMAPEHVKKIEALLRTTDLPVKSIGEVTGNPRTINVIGESGISRTLQKPGGFDHFQR